MIKLTKGILGWLGTGVLLGLFLVVAFRFVSYKSDAVHYHANFALYINGQRDEFKSFTHYEEVQSCSAHDHSNPKLRVHMHDQQNHLVHVHDRGVTWQQFFANLGYTLGDNLVKTDEGVYVDGTDGNKLEFLLNGQQGSGIANRVIRSEDVLLVNYGKDNSELLKSRYDTITKDARDANTRQDPASCAGSENLTFTTRLKKAIGF